MTGDRLTRWATVTAVLAVAGIAAVVSYQHAYALVRSHGEHGLTARIAPASIDGLIFASSMVLLDCARHGRRVPPLARAALTLGIVATIAANVAHGLDHGPIGALVAAWPAVALVVAYELLIGLLRAQATAPYGATSDEPVEPVDQDGSDPVHTYLASVQAGTPLSERKLAETFGRSRRWARGVIAQARADQQRTIPTEAVQ